MGIEAKSKAFLYVDDSKVICPVRNEEDVDNFQTDMDQYYKWAEENSMEFNSLKFVMLRYGRDEDLKMNTIYFANDMSNVIDSLTQRSGDTNGG